MREKRVVYLWKVCEHGSVLVAVFVLFSSCNEKTKTPLLELAGLKMHVSQSMWNEVPKKKSVVVAPEHYTSGLKTHLSAGLLSTAMKNL